MTHVHNALHRATDLLRGIRRAVGLDSGEDPGVERISETLQPILDMWGRPEFSVLRGEGLFARDYSVAAGAGVRAKLQIFNPAGSKRLVMIDEVYATANTAGYISFWLHNGNLTTLGNNLSRRDTRFPTATMVARSYTEATAGNPSGTHMLRYGVLADQGARIPVAWVLPQGWGLTITHLTDNVTLYVSWIGRERVMMPGELLA